MNARPIPRIRFPDFEADSLVSSGFRLTGLAFTEPLNDRSNGTTTSNINGSDNVYRSSEPDSNLDSDRPLGLILALSASSGPKSDKTSLATYKITKRNVVLSDAFANLGSPTLPAKKLDLAGLGRAEWVGQSRPGRKSCFARLLIVGKADHALDTDRGGSRAIDHTR